MATVSFLMAAHLAEVLLLGIGLRYRRRCTCGQRISFISPLVNYTTLGYGDLTPAERWQLLGPMTAMNGVLLFGWSTAVLFEILRRVAAPARS